MHLVPQRTSLAAHASDILKRAILDGEWKGGRLPGERALCERMQIGRDTLRLALADLEREGWIAPAQPGCRRQLLRAGKGKERPRLRHVFFLSPKPLERLPPTVVFELEIASEILAASGYQFEVLTTPAFQSSRCGTALKKLVGEVDPGAWILHQSTLPMQRWFEKERLPAVLHGSPHEGVGIPSIDIDHRALGRHAAGVLLGRGHTRIAFAALPVALAGLREAEAGMREAMAAHGKSLPAPQMLLEQPGAKADALFPALDLAWAARDRPTALIATRSRQVLSVMCWLAKAGRSMPKHLSVISLEHNQYLGHLHPPVPCYRVNVKLAAKRLAKMAVAAIEGRLRPGNIQKLMPDFEEA